MKRMARVLFVFFFVVAAAIAADPNEPPEKELLEKIRVQQTALAADLDAGKTAGLTPRQVGAIRRAQKDVFVLVEGKNTMDDLSIDEKVRLENALERINAEVQGGRVAKDSQEVCWRERMSGSQMKVTRCGTEAEKRQAREGARDFLEKSKVCVGDCGAVP